jgi:hypothetical protein
MKHYIWLSLLLALGVVQAEEAAEVAVENKAEAAPAEEDQSGGAAKEVAVENKAEAAPAEEDQSGGEAAGAPAEDQSGGEAKEEAPAEDAAAPKKLKRKGKKGRKGRTARNRRKGHKGGHNASAPSASVLNAYMNRVQSGEMGSTAPESSISATVSNQGGCTTGKCGLAIEGQNGGGMEANASVESMPA